MTKSPLPGSLHGKTLRWTFNDGPVKGQTFEHTFEADGRVTWRSTDKPEASEHHDKASAAVKVSDDVHVVSYLSADSGYTLTVVLNLRDGTAVGFASDGKDWFQQSGRFEVLDRR